MDINLVAKAFSLTNTKLLYRPGNEMVIHNIIIEKKLKST